MLKRTTLNAADRKGLKQVYLATYNGGPFEPHTIDKKSEDGIVYDLIDENGAMLRYYWSKEVYYELKA